MNGHDDFFEGGSEIMKKADYIYLEVKNERN